jgi:hypothetical protein
MCIPLAAKDTTTPPPLFKGLQIQFTAVSWTDFAITSWAMRTGHFTETNPIARLYIREPVLSIAIFATADIVVHWGLTSLWQKNRTMAWILLIVMDSARLYVMYHNLRELR